MNLRKRPLTAFALLLSGLSFGCGAPDETAPANPPEIRFAKAAATPDPTVTAATPSFAPQDTTLDVQITGTGFDAGSQASFQLQGVVDPRVHVNKTRFVKSTQVIANLTIARDAIVSAYDVVVQTASGKKGIGSEAFTVDPASQLPAWTVDATSSVNLTSDGRGEYVSGECGVQGNIFYGNYDPTTGQGGDVSLGVGSGGAGCAARVMTVTLNGVARSIPFITIRRIVDLAVGQSRTQNFVIQADGDRSCTRVGWWTVAEGGAGGQITVTRTADHLWTATTSGPGRCFYFKGQTRIWGTAFTNITASFSIRELP